MARKKRPHKHGRTTPKGTRPDGFRPKVVGGQDIAGPGGADRSRRSTGVASDAEAVSAKVRGAVLNEHPLALLGQASSLAAMIETAERPPPPFGGLPTPDDIPDRATVVEGLLAVDRLESFAMLVALSRLLADDVMARRVDREVARRGHQLPRWLTELDRTVAAGAHEMVDLFGDSDDVIIGVRFVDGQDLTGVLLVDHNSGSVAKDGFAVDDGADAIAAVLEGSDDSEQITMRPLDAADAAARVAQAIDHGSRMWPPFESDSWPAARPLLRWMSSLFPAGGDGYPHREWSEQDLKELEDQFLASHEGRDLLDPASEELRHQRGLVDSLVWLATGYDRGDPLRWSPMRVEAMMLDLVPRKLALPKNELKTFPDLLSRFIRYSHRHRGMPAQCTTETLDHIDGLRPDYLAAISGERLTGPLALLETMGVLDHDSLTSDDVFDPSVFDDDFDEDEDDDGDSDFPDLSGLDVEDVLAHPRQSDVIESLVILSLSGQIGPDEQELLDGLVEVGALGPLADLVNQKSWPEQLLDGLVERVGSVEALDTLDVAPLPDEPVDWSLVPEDCRDRVAEIVAITDHACDALLDVEHRTACRRLVARAAHGDPAVFRRKSRADIGAGAVIWTVGKANDTVGSYGRGDGITVKELAAHLGLASGSFSQRAATLVKAAGLRRIGWQQTVGDPDLYTAATRQRIVQQRHSARAMLESEPR